MGHYDISITMDIYTHVMGDSKLEAVEKISRWSYGDINNKNARVYFSNPSISNIFIVFYSLNWWRRGESNPCP
jgi:hypothetical protein